MTTGQLVGVALFGPIAAMALVMFFVEFVRGCLRYYRDNRPMARRLGKPDPRCARNPPTNKHGRVE